MSGGGIGLKGYINPLISRYPDLSIQHNLLNQSIKQTRTNQNKPNQTSKMLKFLALSLATLTTLVSAGDDVVGNAIVHNNCPYDVYLWSVGSSVGPRQVLTAGQGNYTEPYHIDPSSGGIALKVTRTPNGLYDSSPQLSFAYALDAQQDGVEQKVWWDLSDVFGDPFKGESITAKPTCDSGACEQICWPEGVAPQGGSQVKNCPAQEDVELTLCSAAC